jgi:hypothetical protein
VLVALKTAKWRFWLSFDHSWVSRVELIRNFQTVSLRRWVNKVYVGSGSPRYPGSGMRPICCIMPRSSLTPPMLDGHAAPIANEMHVGLSHRAPGRRHIHKRTFMGAAHGQTARDDVPFSDQLLDGEV